MTVNKHITDLNKAIGKPYSQQLGRKTGKGKGKIRTNDTLRGEDREEAVEFAWRHISSGPSPDTNKLEETKRWVQQKFGIDYSEAHRIVDDAVYQFEQEGGKVKGQR